MAIAYFSTWTTYGTWLPGDARGWFEHGQGLREPDRARTLEAAFLMNEDAITLDLEQRRIVTETITAHCAVRQWLLHAVNCRSNHVHVVVTANACAIEIPREQFKAWSTRKLKEGQRHQGVADAALRKTWWTQRGWDVYIDDEDHLQEVIAYVLERQDR